MKLERVVTLLSWTGLLAADAVHVRVGIATGIAESSQDVGTNARGKNMLLSARLQTRADLKEITQQEATLQKHISRVYSLFEFTKELLLNEEMGGRSPNNKNTAARVDITASMPADVKAAYEQLQKNDKAALGRKGMVGNLMMSKAMGPAIMVPLLQEMYEKFKGDIKRANAQEKRAADRVSKQEKEYVAFQNEGKSYLLEQKKVIDYYKKQREIQHHHYHTMLKMAHAMMQRITKVKQMCADAANGKSCQQSNSRSCG